MKSGSLRYLTKEGFRYLFVNRLMSLASITVLMSCLVIIGVAAMIFFNINAILDSIEAQNIVMVFINSEATDEEIEALGEQLRNTENVANCEFVSHEEGFESVLQDLGDEASVLEGMDSSFLPDGYRVTVDDLSLFTQTVQTVQGYENVESVRENSDLAGRLTRVRDAVTYASIGVILLLFLVALFIIANTVRITMYSRRLEISIMKAVGATNNFIRWPFIVEGILLGILSAVVSEGVLYLLYLFASVSFSSVLVLMNSTFVPFEQFGGWIFLAFVGIGVLTGVFGSLVSMGRYLKEQGSVVSVDE